MIRTAGSLTAVALAAAPLTVLATAEGLKTVHNDTVPHISTGFGNFWASFGVFVRAFIPFLGIFAAFQRWFIAGLTSAGAK
ncbi:hypothetical protein M1D93_00705 [Arthrobacter sp. Z1-9]